MGDEARHAKPRMLVAYVAVVSIAVVSIAVGAMLGGCGDGGLRAGPNPGQVTARGPFRYARGLFREICAGCHSLADAGAHGLREPLDDSNLSHTTQRPLLARFVIENGDSIMPAWKGSLTVKETNALVGYLSEVAGVSERSADGRRTTTLTPRPRPLTPRPLEQRFADGKALFKEMCAGCHALADARAHGTRVDLDAALAPVVDRAAVIRHALRDSPAMPDWTVRLPEDQIESLVTYLSEVAGKGS